MGQYLPVVALAILAVVFAGVSRLASKLLAPSNTTVAKRSPYECGIVPGRETLERFPVRFYLIAMIFIVFDIEIIFLYPWAVIYRDLGRARSRRGPAVRGGRLRVVRLPARQRRARLGPREADAAPLADGLARADRDDHRAPGRPRRSRSSRRRSGRLMQWEMSKGLEGLDHNFLTGKLEDLVKWARRMSVMPATFGLACCAHRDDGHRRRALRHLALRHGDLPGVAPPGRPHDRRGAGEPEDGARCSGRSTTR